QFPARFQSSRWDMAGRTFASRCPASVLAAFVSSVIMGSFRAQAIRGAFCSGEFGLDEPLFHALPSGRASSLSVKKLPKALTHGRERSCWAFHSRLRRGLSVLAGSNAKAALLT